MNFDVRTSYMNRMEKLPDSAKMWWKLQSIFHAFPYDFIKMRNILFLRHAQDNLWVKQKQKMELIQTFQQHYHIFS
jgi:hypothetical protein